MTLPFVVGRIIKDNKVLLGQHEDLERKPYPLFWDLPGGKVNPNETFGDAITREINEETGLQIESIKIYDVFHHSTDTFLSEFKSIIPGVAICYEIKVWGELKPTEMLNMNWYTMEEIKEFKLTPWTKYFLKDILK